MFRVRGTLSAVVLTSSFVVAAYAQNPGDWPTVIDGNPAMSPYAWVDGAAVNGQVDNAVFGGADSSGAKLYICRADLADGTHEGKYFRSSNGVWVCNIGWGSQEIVKTSGFTVLMNTQPAYGQYLAQNWVPKGTVGTFYGGSAGAALTKMRVCRAPYGGGVHPGKEWAGNCNIGYGGAEKVVSDYQLLLLTFDKTAWQQAGSPQTVTMTQSNIQIQPTSTSGGAIYSGSGGTTDLSSTSTMYTQPSSQPVVVDSLVTAQNGFWMKTTAGHCVTTDPAEDPYLALAGASYPSPSKAIQTPRGRLFVSADATATCLDNPYTWFVTDARAGGWFRIRLVASASCATAVEGAQPVIKPCDESRAQLWMIAGSNLVSGLTTDDVLAAYTSAYNILDTCRLQGAYGLGAGAVLQRFANNPLSAEHCSPLPLDLMFERAAQWQYTTMTPKRVVP